MDSLSDSPGTSLEELDTNSEGTLPARRLERLLGKPAAAWSADDLVDLVASRGIRLVSLMHVGADGWLKTLDFVPRSREHLHDILEGGERADGSSLFAGLGIKAGASDILLRPRIASAFLDPFAGIPALVLMCGHAGRDGQPLDESPDTIVRRAYNRLREATQVDLWALCEVEYFLGKRGSDTDIYGADERGYHASSPFVFGQDLRRRALVALAEIGVPIKYGHSEVGYIAANGSDDLIWEQHEIELALAPLPAAAEAVALTQWVLRNLSHGEGMRCSFDPIIRKGHAGSGLHCHFSPVLEGRHSARLADGEALSEPGQWLIAGLVRFGTALMAFGNRSADSFVRLSQAKEAPSAITWGAYDRHALVRLPITATTPDGRVISPPTIEFRLPDGSAHPYLILAGVAQAMLAGRSTIDLPGLLDRTASTRIDTSLPNASSLPSTFPEIAEAIASHRAIFEDGGVFPPGLIDQYLRESQQTQADRVLPRALR